MATIDLQDAYFTIKIDKNYKKFLRFKFEDTLYGFNCLPFGLCTAPFNWEKSKLIPDKKQKFLGFIINSAKMSISLTEENRLKILNQLDPMVNEILRRKKEHINYLELKAAFCGLKCFAKDLSSCQRLLRIDNTTAICYINKMGSIQYLKLSPLSRMIWQWCERRKFGYLRRISSLVIISSQIKKLKSYQIKSTFGKFDIDLFATINNAKCSAFFSWFPDPEAEAVDAFTVQWTYINFYAFPPFALILLVLRKMYNDRAEGVVVVPY